MKNNRFLNIGTSDSGSMLQVSDEGVIKLHLLENEHTVAMDCVMYLGELALVMCYVSGNSGDILFFRLRDSQISDVMDYFYYWDREKLQELKDAKWNSFKSYLQYCLDFVGKNVDVEGLKPTYVTEYVDNRDYGGGVFTYVNIYLSFGISWDDDFERTYDLTKELTSQLIDRKINGDDEYNWLGKILVEFRPTAE